MKLYKMFFVCSVLLAGCATTPSFQKSDGRLGYEVQETDKKSRIRVSLLIRDEVENEFKWLYAMRAVGEECSARGFQYFDHAEYDENNYAGYCYKSAIKKSLGLTFETKGLRKKPSQFVIESLNNKSQTALDVGDEILLFDDKAMNSIAELKDYIFNLSPQEQLLRLVIKRKGAKMSFDEPLAELQNGLGDKEQLNWLRQQIR